MTDKPDHQHGDDAESESPGGSTAEPEATSASAQGPESRWRRDHGSDVPRTTSGALPPQVIVLAIILFALGFYLFRRWRQQYVTYGADSSGELPALLSALGLG